MHILFIICDSVRRDFLPIYGNDWVRTPNLDALAKESVVFDNAWIGSFPTFPNRAEIMAGKHVFHTIGWAPLPAGTTTAQRILQDNDYVTMLITDHYQLLNPGANYHQGFSGHWWFRGHQHDAYITDHVEIKFPCAPEKCRQPDWLVVPYLRNQAYRIYERDWPIPSVVNASVDWLERNYQHDRFLLYLDIFSTHEPWDPPRWYVEPYDPGYEGEEVILPRYDTPDYLTKAELNHVRALYAGVLTMMDKWIGRLIEKLRDLGIWDETAIVFTSDHGGYLGEHNLIGKHTILKPKEGWPMYREITGIPLLIRCPGVEGGRRCGALVQPVDLMPTLLELGGARPPDGIHGKSLLPLLRGEVSSIRDVAVSSHTLPTAPDMLVWSAITDGEWTLMEPGKLAEPELYHLPADPTQSRNVIGDKRDVARRLHEEYIGFLRDIGTEEKKLRLREWKAVP
ncbi:MAG: sulfatase [Planctomycetota bacterium]